MEPLQLLLIDTESGEVHFLHGPHTELDVMFDVLSGTMTLKQKVIDPTTSSSSHRTAIHFTQSNSAFVNLEGLTDNSLLFTFRPLSPLAADVPSKTMTKQDSMGRKLKVRTFVGGFSREKPSMGPLFKHAVDICGPNKVLQLHLPQSRINDWATAALILLTYREINLTAWAHMARNERLQEVAGLNWAQIKEKASPSLVSKVCITEGQQKKLARDAAIAKCAVRLGLAMEHDNGKLPELPKVTSSKKG